MSDPNFLDHFGTNADDLILWMEETERQLRDLEFKYMDQVAVRKSCTQSGFQKRKYPTFTRDVLDYFEIKNRWAQEVSLEQKPEVLEVNALRDQVPLIAKNKLHEITLLTEAWDILDQLYGQYSVSQIEGYQVS